MAGNMNDTTLIRDAAYAFSSAEGWCKLPFYALRTLDLDVVREFMQIVIERNTNASGKPTEIGKRWQKHARRLRTWKDIARWRLAYLQWHTKHFAPKLP